MSVFLLRHHAICVHFFFFHAIPMRASWLLYPHIQSFQCIIARLSAPMEKGPTRHSGAWLSLLANRAALDCVQFCGNISKYFFTGNCAIPSEEIYCRTPTSVGSGARKREAAKQPTTFKSLLMVRMERHSLLGAALLGTALGTALLGASCKSSRP